MKHTAICLVAAGILTVWGTGCAKKGVDDQALTNAVQAKLYSDATTRQVGVNVSVKDGIVTLSGEVPSADVALEAVKVANGTEGVRGVNQQLKINSAAATPPPGATPTAVPDSTKPAAKSAPSKVASNEPPPSPAYPGKENADQSAADKPVTSKPAVRAEPVMVTVPAGTRVSVRTIDTIDSSKATAGQTFRGSLDAPLVSGGRVAVPAGADVSLVITSAQSAGRIKGSSALALKVSSIEYQGKTYNVSSSDVSEVGKSRGKNTALKTGIGAAAGALIGGLAGGGKGAAIGAAAGGGAGFGWNALTRGGQVKIPAETVLNFQLAEPLTVPANARTEE